MIKKVRFSFDLTPKKINAVHRFLLILNKLQKHFNFRALSLGFNQLTLSKKKNVQKLVFVEAIYKRILQQAFFALNSYQKKASNKEQSIKSIRNFSFSVLARFLHKKLRQHKKYGFKKLSAFKTKKELQRLNTFLLNITKVSNSFKKRVILGETFGKLKKASLNHNRKSAFFKALNLFVLKAQSQYLEASFSSILNEGFRRTYVNEIKKRQEKITEGKNHQLSKHEQYKLLRVEINALTKTLQLEQASKYKSKKEDFDRNLILQAKNTQKERITQDFKKITFQNDSLKYELNKKKSYILLKEESRALAESAQNKFRKTYDLLTTEKTKQSMSLKEFSICLNRESLDLNLILKKFGLSKQSIILENIQLKNLQNLYERQIPGYGAGVNIKESESYRKTMEQNVNLREILQILMANIVQGKQRQIGLPKEELNRLIQTSQNLQKGSKVTVTTLSSSSYGFTQ